MPAIGSSSSSSCGRLASARPTSSARCSPCDSASIAVARLGAEADSSSTSRARVDERRVARRPAATREKLVAAAACTASATLSSTLKRCEELRDLERAREAAARALVRRQARDVVRRRRRSRPRSLGELAGELRDQRRLAGAVRADQRVHLAARARRGRRVGRDDAAEALVEAAHVEQRLRRRASSDARGARRAVQQADEPVAREQHDGEQHPAGPELPVPV